PAGELPAAETSLAATAAPLTPAAGWEFPDDPFTYVFQRFDAGRLHVQDPIVVSRAYQIAALHIDGLVTNDHAVDASPIMRPYDGDHGVYAYLTVYRPGAFDPHRFTGDRLIIDGHQAIEQEGPSYGENLRRALAWEYTDNAWAVAEAFADPSDVGFADLRDLVGGLRPSVPAPA
ncbi:hypothetical protein ACFQZ8_32510, partial [Micromonospora azadirachtae]